MRRLFAFLPLALALSALAVVAVRAQQIVVSPAPEAVAVSVYRAPDRDADTAMTLDWLEGYALVTETRTVAIPAGRATIRFEGVAAGLFPESAIVTGLPDGVREKNLDADLLSPRSLYARMFGRTVTLRRTLPGSGKVVEERAVIRSGPDGAAIVQTAAGFEVADCGGGTTDELMYSQAPADFSARPTLSIETQGDAARTVTLSLSYLAWGFDWQANYVVRMNRDGRSADLDAWVTLASSDSTRFADAETAVIAGKVNREDGPRGDGPSGGELVLRCFLRPMLAAPPPVALPAPPPAPMVMMEADIVVTAQRSMGAMAAPVTVQREELGDLKLYRVPVPVTVAANAQKQVALMRKRGVKLEALYHADIIGTDSEGVRQMLRTRNRKQEGLGLPLPGGPLAVFEPHGDTMLLAGEGSMPDRAEGEDVEIMLSGSTQVTLETEVTARAARSQTVRLTARNARPVPVRFEARINHYPGTVVKAERPGRGGGAVLRKDGRTIWAVDLPANAEVTWSYRLVEGG